MMWLKRILGLRESQALKGFHIYLDVSLSGLHMFSAADLHSISLLSGSVQQQAALRGIATFPDK